jgi:hypothetical protein
MYQRLLVFNIAPKAADFTADITFVPEAPSLWGNATGARIAREEGLLDSLVLILDAGDGASYAPSSGTLWRDTSGQGNDFFFGPPLSGLQVDVDQPFIGRRPPRRELPTKRESIYTDLSNKQYLFDTT